jgi:hypothetical protein
VYKQRADRTFNPCNSDQELKICLDKLKKGEETMRSIRGVYDGRDIKPPEDIRSAPDVKVIITFLDDDFCITDKKTEAFFSLSGTWEDNRSAEEIIRDIYESRTYRKEDIAL